MLWSGTWKYYLLLSYVHVCLRENERPQGGFALQSSVSLTVVFSLCCRPNTVITAVGLQPPGFSSEQHSIHMMYCQVRTAFFLISVKTVAKRDCRAPWSCSNVNHNYVVQYRYGQNYIWHDYLCILKLLSLNNKTNSIFVALYDMFLYVIFLVLSSSLTPNRTKQMYLLFQNVPPLVYSDFLH